jgi:molybdopterin molybdotransferase
MLLAEIPGPRPKFVAGLPGNPQSAIVALMTLVAPLLAGLCGRTEPAGTRITLAEPVPGRGEFTHLVLVRVDGSGLARPVSHTGSAMLRGLAGADGFAVIDPGTHGEVGASVPLLALPIPPGGRP